MLKGQNIKLNNIGRAIGKASCLSLLLLTILAINPASAQANALTEEERTEGSLASTINISFTPTSGNTALSPTDAAGASGLISVLANIDVENSGGYSVYLGSNDTNLVGTRNKDILIPGVSGEVSFDNLQDNTWGYTALEGASIPESATYKAISKGQGSPIFTNNNSRIQSEHKTFALGFAAKISNTLPADTYSNQVTLSVVSSPYQLTLMDIDNLQDMTSSICEHSSQLSTKQLKDTRDGKYYWVTKLADNRCWMTQNLDLDLSTNIALTPADSDVSSNWTPEYSTATTATAETILADNIGQRSWSLGDYRITNPTVVSPCDGSLNSAADCPSRFIAQATPPSANNDANAHYILGNHYQWNAVTAGTGGAITSGEATSSICAKGWKLPTATDSGEFQTLINAGTIGTDVPKLTSAPYYFVRGGEVWQNTNLFANAGASGNYWTSTPTSDGIIAYLFWFASTDIVHPSASNVRSTGFSVRCLAR